MLDCIDLYCFIYAKVNLTLFNAKDNGTHYTNLSYLYSFITNMIKLNICEAVTVESDKNTYSESCWRF